MSFRLVQKLVTLNDLERRNGFILRYYTEFGSFQGALRKSGWQSHNYGQFTITVSSKKRLQRDRATPTYKYSITTSCIVQCRELRSYPEELDNNWFYPASALALSFHQVCTCFCLISCEPIVAATVLSTLAHAPESSPDWSWEHYCQEEEKTTDRRSTASTILSILRIYALTFRERTINSQQCTISVFGHHVKYSSVYNSGDAQFRIHSVVTSFFLRLVKNNIYCRNQLITN